MIVLPPEVGEQSGLGKHFQLAPMTWTWQRLDLTTTDGPMRIDVLVFETVNGRQAYGLVGEDAKAFAASTVQATSGLVLPNRAQRRNGDN